VVGIVQSVHEIAVEGMNIAEFGKAIENGLQLF